MDEIEARIYPRKLKDSLQAVAIEQNPDLQFDVRVFPSVKQTSLEGFAQSVSEYVYSLLSKSKIAGISWGYTLSHIVNGLRKHCTALTKKSQPIQFLPLSGEPLGNAITHVSSSMLASQFDEIMNGKIGNSLSLAAIPALIPMTFCDEKLDTIYELIELARVYRDIFGHRNIDKNSQQPLIEKVDTMLTSVGSSDTTFSHNDDGLIKAGGISRSALRDTLIGDISGVPIPRTKLNDDGRVLVDSLIEHWTGVKEEHVQRCAEHASRRGAPGVIAIGIGQRKADVMYECIARGFVNHALIDQELATALTPS